MTKEYFIQLAGYNVWANELVHSWLEKINEEQWNRPLISSFPGIAATVVHVVSAERVWLDRMKGVPHEQQVWFSTVFKGTKQEAIEEWRKTSKEFKMFLESFDENKLQTELAFKRLNGDPYSMPHYQLFSHVFNHSTYHRGQIVTMLREVGFTEVGSTDLIQYYRK